MSETIKFIVSNIAVVNADEPYRRLWGKDIGQRTQITFGVGKGVDVSGWRIGTDLIKVTTPNGEIHARLQAIGSHTLYNALAATAACLGIGISLEDIKIGLESTEPIPGRLVRLKGIGGSCILDDCYNANPASLHAALEAQRQESGEPWLVFGDMGELGDKCIELHKKAGEMAREFGVTRLLALGDLAKHTVDSFGVGATHFSGHAAVIKVLQKDLRKETCVLVKGSRAMQLEKIVKGICPPVGSQAICSEHVA